MKRVGAFALSLGLGLGLAVTSTNGDREYVAGQDDGASSLCMELGGTWRTDWCDIDLGTAS